RPRKMLSVASSAMPATKSQTEIERQPRNAAISATAPPQTAPAYAIRTMALVFIKLRPLAASMQTTQNNAHSNDSVAQNKLFLQRQILVTVKEALYLASLSNNDATMSVYRLVVVRISMSDMHFIKTFDKTC